MRGNADVGAALIYRAEKRTARLRQDQAHSGSCNQIPFDVEHCIVHRIDIRAFWRVDVDVKLRFIDVARNVFLFHQSI